VPPKIIKACEGLLDPRFGDRELVRSNVDGRIIPRQNAVRDVLEAILARSVNWVQTLATAAQSVDETSERSFILSVGGDSITESVTKTHHIVRVQAVMSEDSIHDLPLRVA
jgi:malonyl CoA-acyl carrier protein transacylase